MNNEQLSTTKEIYNTLSEIISTPTIHISLLQAFPQIKNISPDKIFWIESLKFMAWISNSDGNISQRELNVMNYITGVYMSLESIQEIMHDNEFLDSMTDAPLTVKILCEVENMLYENNATSSSDSLMNILILYFETIGKLVADADNDISTIEYTRINKYIEIIKEYAAEHTLSPFFKY